MKSLTSWPILEISAPQPTLFEYIPKLAVNNRNFQVKSTKAQWTEGRRWKTDLKLAPNGIVEVKDRHCPHCNHWLRKYGQVHRNTIVGPPILMAHAVTIQSFQRYFCPTHGEIFIDYETIVAFHGQYHPVYLQLARLLFSIGFTAGRIRVIFLAIYQLIIPENTILAWIVLMRIDLPLLFEGRDRPCSGYLMYDEIHLRLERQKKYAQIVMDGQFGFILGIYVAKHLTKETIQAFFIQTIITPQLPFKSVTHDDHASYTPAFDTPELKEIPRQLDLAHTKKRIRSKFEKICRKVNKGRGIQSNAYEFLIRGTYKAVEARTEEEFEWRMDVLETSILLFHYPKIQEFFAQLRGDKPRLLAHLSDPEIPLSSSAMESVNNEVEQYRPLKWDLKNDERALFILQARSMMRNSRCLSKTEKIFDRREQALHDRKANGESSSQLDTDYLYLKWLRQQLHHYRAQLHHFWEKYFPKGSFDVFQKSWSLARRIS
jgi:hypothetical protein